ncbi:DUF4470 domain-containing protein [Mycena venus]|uniref:DUF4470 domain-containing protein n=1 Tax=Mycena venus TaxID=2733690 RepID=A0A8H7CRE2_9AGAR|nr:DUF4470 domain-containing protein [Mycena venus]
MVFALASGDLRNLIRTVNSLPWDYAGYCDILLNNTNPVLVNRNLVILFVLLSSGPSIEEAAEFCTHLMYSAALPEAGAEYVKRCINFIYSPETGGEPEADLSFRRCLDTRGEGKVYAVQPSAGIKRLLEMSHSNYTLSSALQSMKDATLAPDRLDFREKYYAGLKPPHRMAFQRFRESGILAPFSLNTSNFTQPNRLLFSPQGVWMVPEDANALFGWDVSGVQNSGIKHGTSPEDILGCLFFHVKDELREVRAAGQGAQDRYPPHLVRARHPRKGDRHRRAAGLRGRELRPHRDGEPGRLGRGLRACLSDWGPLLNRENEFASILMQTKAWHAHAHAAPQWGAHAVKVLEEKCSRVPGLDVRMKTVFTQGLRSPALCRIFESLDVFHDNEPAFQEYLSDQDAERAAAAFDLQLRSTHRVHPKRFGIPLNAPRWQKLPDLSSNEFYDLYTATIGGANLPVRFLEFEGIGATDFE